MKTEYYTTKWLRRLEMASLIQSIVGTPLLLFVMALQFFILVPPEYLNYKLGFALIFGALAFLFGFGIIFGIPLKHYIYHQEKRDDWATAIMSFIFIFVDIFLVLLILWGISSFP